MNMPKLFLFLLSTTLFFGQQLSGQQLGTGSPLADETDFLSNPAITAADRITTISAGITSEWLGFNDAPTTLFAAGQLAIKNQPISLGLFVESDEFLPFTQRSVGLTYAYHLGGYGRKIGNGKRSFSGQRKRGQLSIGLSTAFRQTAFDPRNLVSSDPTDQLFPAGSEMNSTSPVIGAGVYYLSALSGPEGKSFGSLGLAFRQIIDFTEENSDDFAGLPQDLHGNLVLRYHHEASDFILKPQLRLDFAANSPSSARFTIIAERAARYWGGLSYNINQSIALQTGYVISPKNSDNQLRIGALGTFNMGSAVSDRGLGYSAFLAYRLRK
ncbi:hypothetical protein CEQ90_09470 [Lewinellaceae bacterium SD302]|nr:hypothetical protein CEQ90_09470 [Lewinellaceae bacterium SD302]